MTSTAAQWLLALIAVAVVAAPAAGSAAAPAPASDDRKLRAELAELSRRRVFFGHQSVGENLVAGLERLSRAQGSSLKLVRVEGPAAPVAPGTFAHALVPRNGEPLLKLESFERALATHGPVDVALVKFCYVDIQANTDVRALFQAYQATLARLEARHPQTTFVRVTVPLMTVQRGPKAMVKKLIGRDTTGVVENARREELNALIRDAAGGKAPLFDLARVESTRPDGTQEDVEWSGRRVRALVPAYTTDGGHLNPVGQDRAARELASVLAAAPLREAPPAAAR